MILLLKIILLSTLFSVFVQDIKDRKVYWFLFPIAGICSGILFLQNTLLELFVIHIAFNVLMVCTLLLTVCAYAILKLKTHPKHVFGLGDVFIFLALALSFASVSFVVIFIFSLLSALVLHMSLKMYSKNKTVPLAGYMSLFFALVYVGYWVGIIENVYQI